MKDVLLGQWVVFLPVVAVLFVAAMVISPFLIRKVQQEEFGGIWLDFAERYGYHYRTGFWSASIFVEGERDGYQFKLTNWEGEVGQHHREMMYSNWVQVELRDERWKQVRVRKWDPLEALAARVLGTKGETGDPWLDENYLVTGAGEELLGHLSGLSGTIQQLRGRYVEVEVNGGKAHLKLSGQIEEREGVRELLDEGMALARMLDTPGPF